MKGHTGHPGLTENTGLVTPYSQSLDASEGIESCYLFTDHRASLLPKSLPTSVCGQCNPSDTLKEDNAFPTKADTVRKRDIFTTRIPLADGVLLIFCGEWVVLFSFLLLFL